MAKEFNWVEGVTTIKDLVKSLAVELTTATMYQWALKEPATTGEIASSCILETGKKDGKKFYLKISRPEGSLNHVTLQVGDKFDATKKDLASDKCSAAAKFSWYREATDLYLGEWLPVQYWLSFSSEYANIVLQGDPSPDQAPYNHYLISYAYVGSLQGYEKADEDVTYNFALTCGADTFLAESGLPKDYGNRTGTGVTDIVMVGTRTGTPYQAHYPAFHTTNPFMDKNFISASAWTHKYHFSEVVVMHAYDRERGKLQNVLVGDRSAVFHLDELIQDKGLDTEKTYKMFNLNAPYSFLNNGPNVLYGIAIRKS